MSDASVAVEGVARAWLRESLADGLGLAQLVLAADGPTQRLAGGELRALAGIASTADLLTGAITLRAQCLHLAQQRPI